MSSRRPARLSTHACSFYLMRRKHIMNWRTTLLSAAYVLRLGRLSCGHRRTRPLPAPRLHFPEPPHPLKAHLPHPLRARAWPQAARPSSSLVSSSDVFSRRCTPHHNGPRPRACCSPRPVRRHHCSIWRSRRPRTSLYAATARLQSAAPPAARPRPPRPTGRKRSCSASARRSRAERPRPRRSRRSCASRWGRRSGTGPQGRVLRAPAAPQHTSRSLLKFAPLARARWAPPAPPHSAGRAPGESPGDDREAAPSQRGEVAESVFWGRPSTVGREGVALCLHLRCGLALRQ